MVMMTNPFAKFPNQPTDHFFERLGGSTLINPATTATFEDDFNTNDWDDAGTRFGVNTTTEKFDFDAVNDGTNDASVYDLGSGNVSDTAWVLRAELNFSTISYGEDCFFYIVMSGSNQSAGETTNQKFIGTRLMTPNNATKRYDTIHGTASNLDVLADNQYYTFLENTPYFVEIIRTGSNTFTVEIFTGSFGGTSLGKISTSGISGVTGLQFIKFANRMSGGGSGQYTGTIDNVEFYNGVTTLTNKPTNVQDNSIMVEKDTARRYWFTAEGESPTTSAYFGTSNIDGATNKHIAIPVPATVSNGAISFWINVDSNATQNGDYTAFSFSNSGAASEELIFSYVGQNSNIHVMLRTGSTVLNCYTATNSVTRGEWTHIVYSNNTSTGHKIYINGVAQSPTYSTGSAGQNIFSANLTVNSTTIGANRDSGGYQWGMVGYIQDVLLYDKTLTQADVTALYNNGNFSDPDTTNLVRRYVLDGNSNDTSGNSQNGTDTSITYPTTTTVPPTPATWTMNPTFEDDFSSYADQSSADAVWVSNDTGDFRVNVTNDNLAYDSKVTGTTNQGIYYDFGTALSDTAWVLDFKMVISTLTLYSGGSVGAATYITMNNSGTGGAIGGSVDAIGFYMSSTATGGRFTMTNADSSPLNIAGGTLNTINATGTYYVRIIRLSSTSMRLELHNDPARTASSLIEGQTKTGISSGITGLKYFRLQDNQSSAGTGTGQNIGTIDDIKIYNGVTTPN